MLKALGVIFYIVAALCGLGAVLTLSDGAFSALIAITGAISSAFFGAMCFAADTIVQLLRRILNNLRDINPNHVAQDQMPPSD